MLTCVHYGVRLCSGHKAKAEKLVLDLAQCIVQASLPGASLAQVQSPSWPQSKPHNSSCGCWGSSQPRPPQQGQLGLVSRDGLCHRMRGCPAHSAFV